MLVDSGAEISIIAIKGYAMEAANQVRSVSGIGGAQNVGPKTECKIRFTCDTENEYSVWLHAAMLDRDRDLIILGRGFVNQFENTTLIGRTGRFVLVTHGYSWCTHTTPTGTLTRS